MLTPHFLSNFSMSFDYFNIKLQDTIGKIGADTIINNCITTGDPAFCGAIHRDPNGSLFKTLNGFISDTNVNFGSLTTRGVDAKLNYRLPIDAFGSLLFNLEGTRLINLGTQPLTGGPAYDCAGYFGTTCGAPNAKWRHVLNTTWATPWSAFDLTARWRFLSGSDSEQLSPNTQLAGNPLPLTQHIKPYSYFDLSADVSLYKMFKLQFGINNVLDKDPPIIASSGTTLFRRTARRLRRTEAHATEIPSQSVSIPWVVSSSPASRRSSDERLNAAKPFSSRVPQGYTGRRRGARGIYKNSARGQA